MTTMSETASTIGALRKLLQDHPEWSDDMLIVVDGHDHTYFRADAGPCVAHDEGNRQSFGHYGGESMEDIHGPKVTVFMVAAQ